MKINTKLMLSFMATVLLPILIVTYITITNGIGQAKAQFFKASQLDISLVEQSFDQFFEVIGFNVSFMADMKYVRETETGSITTYFNEPKSPARIAQMNGGREQNIFEIFSSIGDNNQCLAMST